MKKGQSMKCMGCESENTELREVPQQSKVMYDHRKCNDCGLVFFQYRNYLRGGCGGHGEAHWAQLAIDAEAQAAREAAASSRRA